MGLASATLFTPGRASYITSGPEAGQFTLNLTEASAHRADVASRSFDPVIHTSALYAGECPGIAQDWPAEHTTAIRQSGQSEASLMAQPLITRLRREGYDEAWIAGHVLPQGESNNSIGDVRKSIELGLLNPDDFNTDGDVHGLDLVAGWLQGIVFVTF